MLSIFPRLGKLLPRPGSWMTVMKQFLAFPVFAAAAYFLWVYTSQMGIAGLSIGLIGALSLAFAAWLFQGAKSLGMFSIVLRIISLVIAVGAILFVYRAPVPSVDGSVPGAQSGEGALYGAIASTAFDGDQVAQENADGKDVFIDFTAAWCVTCQFDKLTIFSDDEVARAFAERDIVFMVADWTVREPKITAALEAYGASGVPFYVFEPANGESVILPLPMTKSSVLKVISAP